MGQNITIDGVTYNNIESVSINGTSFSVASKYAETVIKNNYSPNGNAFVETIPVNFEGGDYIEAQIDVTNSPNERIVFSVGTNISVYPGKTEVNNADGIYIYAKQYDNNTKYSVAFLHGDSDLGPVRSINGDKAPVNNKTNIKISAAGVYIDDVLLQRWNYTDRDAGKGNAIDFVMPTLLQASSIQVGAAQNDNQDYSYAYYDYIKVFRKVS